MKKYIGFLLLLALLLAGCTQTLPPDSQPDATLETTQPAQARPQGIYVPDSAVEKQSFGAVSVYDPKEQQLLGLATMGEKILLVSQQAGAVKLTFYEGETLIPAGELVVSDGFRLDGAAVHINENSISYYDGVNREVVLVGEDRLEKERVVLPEDAVGEPAVASDFSAVYYSTGNQIRVLDIKTGIVRLLREMADRQVRMQSVCFQNSVLVCQVTEGEESYTAFLSAETGETFNTDEVLLSFDTWGDSYFAQRRSASITEQLFGVRGESIRMLNPASISYECWAVPEMSAALTTVNVSDRGISMELYELDSGKRTASALLPGAEKIIAVAGKAGGEALWLIAEGAEGDSWVSRWDLSKSRVYNPVDYTSPRYTRENPDKEGLARCVEKAEELSRIYGVDVRILAEDLVDSANNTMTAEYQVRALKKGLSALETALSRFPEGFFRSLSEVTSDNVLHISIVQSIHSRGKNYGPAGLRYWVGTQEYIAIQIYEDVEQGLYHELFHALDTYLLANSSILDGWNALNPEGFAYDNHLNAYENRPETPYLTGETRAFVDSYSMTYAVEDKARVFEFAMMPGHEEYFTSETMQAKLEMICMAIREAYDWKEDPRQFPWEQYLAKPLIP